QSRSSTDQPAKLSTEPILSSVLKKTFRLSTLAALISKRTLCQEKLFNSWAISARVSVTAEEEPVRSSARKLQFCSQTTLPPPKKGSVCSASRSFARALSASPLLETEASMIP